jgi:hypothetical protein
MNLPLGTRLAIGEGPIYNRTALPIIGGTFTGPRMNGTVANLGTDWGVVDKQGITHPDTRYHLLADGGPTGVAGIYLQTSGWQQPDGRIQMRMTFETGNPYYIWLNYVIGVGILSGAIPTPGSSVTIDAWQVSLVIPFSPVLCSSLLSGAIVIVMACNVKPNQQLTDRAG